MRRSSRQGEVRTLDRENRQTLSVAPRRNVPLRESLGEVEPRALPRQSASEAARGRRIRKGASRLAQTVQSGVEVELARCTVAYHFDASNEQELSVMEGDHVRPAGIAFLPFHTGLGDCAQRLGP